jgi:hypothetical protein
VWLTKSTWPASRSVVHRFERSDGLLAELSSRTFWGWRASHHSTRPTAIDDCAATYTVLLPLPIGPMRRYYGGRREAKRVPQNGGGDGRSRPGLHAVAFNDGHVLQKADRLGLRVLGVWRPPVTSTLQALCRRLRSPFHPASIHETLSAAGLVCLAGRRMPPDPPEPGAAVFLFELPDRSLR